MKPLAEDEFGVLADLEERPAVCITAEPGLQEVCERLLARHLIVWSRRTEAERREQFPEQPYRLCRTDLGRLALRAHRAYLLQLGTNAGEKA